MIEFCCACAIIDETLKRFGLIIERTDMISVGCLENGTHILRADIDHVPDMVSAAMTELMEADVLPGLGCIVLTTSTNFLVISEVTHAGE